MERKLFFLGLFLAIISLVNFVCICKLIFVLDGNGCWASIGVVAAMCDMLVAAVIVIVFALKYND